MKKRLLTLITALLLIATLAACQGDSTPGDLTEDTTAPATQNTEATTAPESEPETEEPVQIFTPSAEAQISDKLKFDQVYSVTPTTREETVTVQLDGTTLNVKMNTTYYGTESAIDRDTYHWGNILRYTNHNVTEFSEAFRVGDLNGDRRGEILTYKDGVLRAYTLPKASKKVKKLTEVFSQELGFAGVLCGTGHVNGDLYTDILLYDADAARVLLALGGKNGFEYVYAGALEGVDALRENDHLLCGDVDADGVCEIVLINDLSVRVYKYAGNAFALSSSDTLPYAESGQFMTYAVSDINSDGAADVIGYLKDPGGADFYGTRSYMSRRDGHFGSYEQEGDNKNLNVTHIHNERILPLYAAGGDVTGDGVDDIALIGQKADGTISIYAVEYVVEAPAYDYSSHVIKTEDGYILYTGGLYIDYNTDTYPQTDGDHIVAYTSKDGLTWHRNLDAACFYLGGELGMGGYQAGDVYSEKWWYGNTMEPEVIYVDGVYYMYYQVENYTYDRSGNLMGQIASAWQPRPTASTLSARPTHLR